MDSRIPKPSSGLKPPVVKNCDTTKTVPPEKRCLRRRSKSVVDLRTLTSKPIQPLFARSAKIADKGVTKTTQKRPFAKNTEDVKEPKVPKLKIPDWDYKSRYHELQKKYSSIQDELKLAKSRITDFDRVVKERDDFEEVINRCRRENSDLNNRIDVMRQEIEVSRKENDRLTCQLQNLEEINALLNEKYVAVSRENDENKIQLMDIKNLEAQKSVELEELTCQLQNLQEINASLNEKYVAVSRENHENKIQLMDTKNLEAQKSVELEELKVKHADLKTLTDILKKDIEVQEEVRRTLHNSIQDLKGNIRVFCRVRPPINEIEEKKPLAVMSFADENTLEVLTKGREVVGTSNSRSDVKLEFIFDKVFPPEARHGEIFTELSQLIQSALDGFHVCVFAYGQTGSGKTFTMQGSSADQGMIPRTIDFIFEKIEKLQHHDWDYTVESSFVEIYNESIKDLLHPDSKQQHELRSNEGRGVTVTNVKIVQITSPAHLRKLMVEAQKNRAVASTDFNEHSSRSHAVTKIHLKGINSASNITYIGSINLVDLAGSESAKTSAKERLTETKNINKSLSTLGNVMLALHNKDSHVPYRDSKLTYLLQSCLGGNSKSLMFVNISPFEECLGESINSLRFAAKVKDVKTSAKRNKVYKS